MDLRNRRRHPRIYRPVELNYNFENKNFSENTLSLSMGGSYVKTSEPLEVGSIFPLDFTLPKLNHSFNVKGKVVWKKTVEDKNGPPGMGIKFIDAREEDKEALLHFIVRAQVTQKGY